MAQGSEHFANDVALEASDGFLLGLSLALALLDVVFGSLVVRHSGHGDLIKRPVGSPIAPLCSDDAAPFSPSSSRAGQPRIGRQVRPRCSAFPSFRRPPRRGPRRKRCRIRITEV